MKIESRPLIAAILLATAAGCANRTNPQALNREPSLGLSQEPLQPLSEAQAALNPAANLTAIREPWRFEGYEGQLIITAHYRIYTTIQNESILDRLPTFCQRALEHYTTAITPLPMPPARLETYLFQSRNQWQSKTEQMLPDQARMFGNLGRGGFTTKGTSVLYYIDRRGRTRDTFAIAAHEGWHQYTQQTFKHQLPIWLEEGVATYMEGYRDRDGLPNFEPGENYERLQTLYEAARGERLIPLEDLLTRSPQSFLADSKDMLLVYYAQVWALTRFLAEGQDGRYRPALAQVLQDAAHGNLVGRMMNSRRASSRRLDSNIVNRIGTAVAQEYFNRDLIEFESEYRDYIKDLIRRR